MDTARPLRDVFTELLGGGGAHAPDDAAAPAEALRAGGHPDLPDSLVAEAVGSFADTAPVEVAEHLASYVMAHSPVPLPEAADVAPEDWYDAILTAPPATGHDPFGLDELPDLDGAATSPADPGAHHVAAHPADGGTHDDGLDFGVGDHDPLTHLDGDALDAAVEAPAHHDGPTHDGLDLPDLDAPPEDHYPEDHHPAPLDLDLDGPDHHTADADADDPTDHHHGL